MGSNSSSEAKALQRARVAGNAYVEFFTATRSQRSVVRTKEPEHFCQAKRKSVVRHSTPDPSTSCRTTWSSHSEAGSNFRSTTVTLTKPFRIDAPALPATSICGQILGCALSESDFSEIEPTIVASQEPLIVTPALPAKLTSTEEKSSARALADEPTIMRKKRVKKVLLKLSEDSKPKRRKTAPKPKTFRGFWPGQRKAPPRKSKSVRKKRKVKKARIDEPQLDGATLSELRELDELADTLRRKLEKLRTHRDRMQTTRGRKHPVTRKLNKLAETLSEKLEKNSMRRYELRTGITTSQTSLLAI